ncbi:hypothetical protein F5B19DRAFT_167482 [Rostrohypoxylon terebratum]|nr:hypothetical protein F5B19DRAFT_167482 [Rostrohypoxylon terebratum]
MGVGETAVFFPVAVAYLVFRRTHSRRSHYLCNFNLTYMMLKVITCLSIYPVGQSEASGQRCGPVTIWARPVSRPPSASVVLERCLGMFLAGFRASTAENLQAFNGPHVVFMTYHQACQGTSRYMSRPVIASICRVLLAARMISGDLGLPEVLYLDDLDDQYGPLPRRHGGVYGSELD